MRYYDLNTHLDPVLYQRIDLFSIKLIHKYSKSIKACS